MSHEIVNCQVVTSQAIVCINSCIKILVVWFVVKREGQRYYDYSKL